MQKLRDEDFDLLICDQHMPHATGEQVALVANTITPLTRVILLTGSADRYNDDPSGVPPVLSKPFTSSALLDAIVKVME